MAPIILKQDPNTWKVTQQLFLLLFKCRFIAWQRRITLEIWWFCFCPNKFFCTFYVFGSNFWRKTTPQLKTTRPILKHINPSPKPNALTIFFQFLSWFSSAFLHSINVMLLTMWETSQEGGGGGGGGEWEGGRRMDGKPVSCAWHLLVVEEDFHKQFTPGHLFPATLLTPVQNRKNISTKYSEQPL